MQALSKAACMAACMIMIVSPKILLLTKRNLLMPSVLHWEAAQPSMGAHPDSKTQHVAR